jgi:hypothetical protein
MKRTLFITALLLKFVLLAHANNFVTAANLKSYCQSLNNLSAPGSTTLSGPTVSNQVVDEVFQAGACAGFMNGWLQGVAGLALVDKSGKTSFIDIAPGINAGQMARVFVEFLTLHPEFEIQTADFALTRALTAAHLVRLVPVKISDN